jgi:hypothetical protein
MKHFTGVANAPPIKAVLKPFCAPQNPVCGIRQARSPTYLPSL